MSKYSWAVRRSPVCHLRRWSSKNSSIRASLDFSSSPHGLVPPGLGEPPFRSWPVGVSGASPWGRTISGGVSLVMMQLLPLKFGLHTGYGSGQADSQGIGWLLQLFANFRPGSPRCSQVKKKAVSFCQPAAHDPKKILIIGSLARVIDCGCGFIALRDFSTPVVFF